MGSTLQGDVCVAPIVGPPSRSDAEQQHRERVTALLHHLWRDRSGYGISEEEEAAISRAGHAAHVPEKALEPGKKTSTYGEVTLLGARQIARALGVDRLDGGQPLFFMDLGCGVGKLVVQAHLEWPAVARSSGVELSSSRVSRGRAAWLEALEGGEADELRADALRLLEPSAEGPHPALLAAPRDAVTLIEGDLFDVDMAEVTHVYVASLCFNEAMLLRLGRKLAADAPRLQAVAALRRFPEGISGLEVAGTLEAEMSWTRQRGGGQTVHLYKRRADSKPEL